MASNISIFLKFSDGTFGSLRSTVTESSTAFGQYSEITTEGGLDLVKSNKIMRNGISRLRDSGIRVSLFIDPSENQIKESRDIGADDIELHTGCYASKNKVEDQEKEFKRLFEAAEIASNQKLQVNAGHGLNYLNTQRICSLPNLNELNIGHSIISRSVSNGLAEAVQTMRRMLNE